MWKEYLLLTKMAMIKRRQSHKFEFQVSKQDKVRLRRKEIQLNLFQNQTNNFSRTHTVLQPGEQRVLRWLDNQAVAYTVTLKKSSVLHYVKIIKFESLRKWHTFSF